MRAACLPREGGCEGFVLGVWNSWEKLGDRGSQAVGYFAHTILTMARATEGIIDSVLRDWFKREQRE